MRYSIPLAQPDGWIADGPAIDEFEEKFAAYVGRAHCVALSSGTAALHLALLAVGVKQGQIVRVPSLTFVATGNAALYCGARVELHGRMLPFGYPIDTPQGIVWDVAQAVGGHLPPGRAWCYSFAANKTLTCGRGGAVVTDSDMLARKVRHLANQAKDDPTEYLHSEVGYNYRPSNLNFEIGCRNLAQLPAILDHKARAHEWYHENLDGLDGLRVTEALGDGGQHWLNVIRVEGGSRALLRYLAHRGIESRPLWVPLHMQPAFSDCATVGDFAEVEALYADCLCLPSGNDITAPQIDTVCDAIKEWTRGS